MELSQVLVGDLIPSEIFHPPAATFLRHDLPLYETRSADGVLPAAALDRGRTQLEPGRGAERNPGRCPHAVPAERGHPAADGALGRFAGAFFTHTHTPSMAAIFFPPNR